MKRYLATKFATKFAYYAAIGIIIINSIVGFGVVKIFSNAPVLMMFGRDNSEMMGIGLMVFGVMAGAFVGIVSSIPMLMYCEMAYAIIKTEENTRKPKVRVAQVKTAA